MKVVLAGLFVLCAVPVFAQAEPAQTDAFLPVPVVGQFACRAQNARGEIFREVGLVPAVVQERALATCRASSAVCHPLGCDRI